MSIAKVKDNFLAISC